MFLQCHLAHHDLVPQIPHRPGNPLEPLTAGSNVQIRIAEIKDHGKISLLPNKIPQLLIGDTRSFRDGDTLIMVKGILLQFAEKVSNARLIAGHLRAGFSQLKSGCFFPNVW